MKSVSNRIAQLVLSQLDHADRQPRLVLRQTGIHQYELEAPGGRLSAQSHFRLLSWLADRQLPLFLPKPDLGYLFEHYGALAAVCSNAPSLRAALGQLARFRGLIGQSDHISVQEQPDGLLFEYHSDCPDPRVGTTSSLHNFHLLQTLVRHYVPDLSQALRLTHQGLLSRVDLRLLRQRFDCPVLPGASNSLLLSPAELDTPYAGFNPALRPYQEQQAQQMLDGLGKVMGFGERIGHLIRERLRAGEGEPAQEAVQGWLCDSLNISRWTLLRRLQEEGVGFMPLYNRLRLEEACRWLRRSDHSMLEISQQLGFTSQSSFSRFFREQMHCSPSGYRRGD
ncbi:helix-turn-helix domain-containing protein [Pseudaeromonas sp. ZJS20]|uniref:helix-turn-helix transcriptional regulator n=1 Tax=Pseudaeromonas aegiceratis TaxID=3153928 RepID=UPI00390CC496